MANNATSARLVPIHVEEACSRSLSLRPPATHLIKDSREVTGYFTLMSALNDLCDLNVILRVECLRVASAIAERML